MPSKLVIALALSPAAALQLPGVGEVALKLPHRSSVLRDAISQFAAAQSAPRSSVSTAAAARGNAQHLRCKKKGDPRGTRAAAAGARANKNPSSTKGHTPARARSPPRYLRARRSAPALPSTKDLKVAAIDFVAEARQNPLSALPAAGAAGVAGLALFAAASSLSPTVVPEGGEYRGLGIGQDGIVRVGFPAGGEQCTNQISRRFSITTCTPSTRRLLDGVAVRFSDRATVPHPTH